MPWWHRIALLGSAAASLEAPKLHPRVMAGLWAGCCMGVGVSQARCGCWLGVRHAVVLASSSWALVASTEAPRLDPGPSWASGRVVARAWVLPLPGVVVVRSYDVLSHRVRRWRWLPRSKRLDLIPGPGWASGRVVAWAWVLPLPGVVVMRSYDVLSHRVPRWQWLPRSKRLD